MALMSTAIVFNDARRQYPSKYKHTVHITYDFIENTFFVVARFTFFVVHRFWKPFGFEVTIANRLDTNYAYTRGLFDDVKSKPRI